MMTFIAALFFCLFSWLRFVSGSSDEQQHVTVLGLGAMGKAIVQCYASSQGGNNYHVHAWNRGEEKRNAVKGLEHVTVHDNLIDAVWKSSIIIMTIDSDKSLAGAEALIRSSPPNLWNNKTLVQFSGHLPTAIKQQDALFVSMGGTLIGGAMIAVPETLCSEQAVLLLSATKSMDQQLTTVLSKLGRVVPPYEGDVGLAALANIGLVQALTFGLAGHEMAHLLLERYGVSSTFTDQYVNLVTEIVPSYVPMLFGVISRSVVSKNWQESYVPSADFVRLLEMHADFIAEMGVASDTYMEGYIRYLKKIPDAAHGPSAWIQHSVKEDKDEL